MGGSWLWEERRRVIGIAHIPSERGDGKVLFDELLAEHGTLVLVRTAVERLDGGLTHAEAAAMRAQPVDSLSGGEKTRVYLARLILEDTDILLLDEPTNHLDLRATEWLEAYLLHFRGTVLGISHDRYFLDRVVQRSIDFTSDPAE